MEVNQMLRERSGILPLSPDLKDLKGGGSRSCRPGSRGAELGGLSEVFLLESPLAGLKCTPKPEEML